MSIRLSVDIGGTFTDVVLSQLGHLTTTKVLTTHADPALGVMTGIGAVLERSAVSPSQIDLVLHGTTLATNALIERRGAPTALLTTAGHRDVIEMASENRFEQYDVNIDRPAPLVPRRWRVGVPERMTFDGQILVPLDQSVLTSALDKLLSEGVKAVAIGYFHSYANAEHEQQTAALIAQKYPQLSVSRSSMVCPEIREYERLSTTVANAYVKPLMSKYLSSLAEQLRSRGIKAQVLMMTSGGGLTTLAAAAEYPIRLVESGPAGGAALAADIARAAKLDQVLSFDMGGTTAKICLIDQGQPQHSRSFEVDRSYRFKKGSGLPVRIPVVEMVEIGAGGGSIVTVDPLQRIQVGPASAGSEPGPACYGRGGEAVTVTDADVVLGHLIPDGFAGGSIQLSAARAEVAMGSSVGQALGLDNQQAAYAAAQIVEENMASAARAHASEWGKALHERCLIAFGGAAPLHAVALASKLKINTVRVPPGAGVGSALGFLRAPIRFEVVRSRYMRLGGLQAAAVAAMFAEMRAEAAQVLMDAGVDVAAKSQVREQRQAYMRYAGQGYEIAVDLDALSTTDEAAFRGGFEVAYTKLYGRTIPDMDIEVLSWTLALTAPQLGRIESLATNDDDTDKHATGERELFDGQTWVKAQVMPRAQLVATEQYAGPMLVIEAQTTTVIPAGACLEIEQDGTLLITLGGRP